MTIKEQIIESKSAIHHAIIGIVMSSAALEVLTKKTIQGIDPVTLMREDAKYSTILLNLKNPDFIDIIADNENLVYKFQQVAKEFETANQKLIALVRESITGEL